MCLLAGMNTIPISFFGVPEVSVGDVKEESVLVVIPIKYKAPRIKFSDVQGKGKRGYKRGESNRITRHPNKKV